MSCIVIKLVYLLLELFVVFDIYEITMILRIIKVENYRRVPNSWLCGVLILFMHRRDSQLVIFEDDGGLGGVLFLEEVYFAERKSVITWLLKISLLIILIQQLFHG